MDAEPRLASLFEVVAKHLPDVDLARAESG